MKRKWIVLEKLPPEIFKKYPDIAPAVLQLLFNRGIVSRDAIDRFLNPEYEKLGSPYLLTGMKQAVERILRAIAAGEQACIYADYDADAVTAATVMYRGLKALGAKNITWYIPDRFAEGYGMNIDAVRAVAEKGAKLMITVDCGINAVEEAAVCASLGLDLVITDHHEITGHLPEAAAIVNPKRNPEAGELQGLTGVGVAFKLIQALFAAIYPQEYNRVFGWEAVVKAVDCLPMQPSAEGQFSPAGEGNIEKAPPHWEKWLLDLVAIGTVADCQSLLGENRILVKYGLKVLHKTKWPGLKLLLRNSGCDDGRIFDTFTCGFIIAPRINAAGRIQHADIAFRLLAFDERVDIELAASQLESLNAHRQRLTEQIFSEARSQVELQLDRKLLLAVGENWPKGVVGLVASRLTEEFSRPVVVLERSDNQATGSARSIESFNIVEAFSDARQYLIRFGGHAQAAGLTIRPEEIDNFHARLVSLADERLSDDDLIRQETVDGVLEPSAINDELLYAIKRFEPFGAGNPPPHFLIRSLNVESVKTVGSTGKHLKMEVSGGGRTHKCIGFSQGYRFTNLSAGDTVDLVVEPSENIWNGRSEIQLKIIDLIKK